MTADASGPMLAGLPVLELSEMVAGPYAAKLLGDLGAHIVKVEPPTGDPARRIGPFVGGVVDPDHSVLFLHLNTSKTSLCLDPDAADHATALASLAGWAELIITDRSPEQLAEVGLDPDALLTAHPGLVILSITPFGTSGPYRGYRADPLTTFHGAGEGYLTPVASHLMPEVVDRPPLRQGRFAAEYKLATYAATLALAAVVHARRTGVGQVVDLSKQDALVGLNFFEFQPWLSFGVMPTRASLAVPLGGIMPCKDGHLQFTFHEEHQWRALVKLIGSPAWAEEEWAATIASRETHADLVNAVLCDWLSTRTRDEVVTAGQAMGVTVAPYLTVDEVMASDQLAERGYFQTVDHPRAGAHRYATGPWRFSGVGPKPGPAPALDSTRRPATVAGAARPERSTPAGRWVTDAPSHGPASAGPLHGLRVIDFTWAVAGPTATMIVASLGAEVIKVETRHRLDVLRRATVTSATTNRQKKAITLNLRHPKAVELAKALVAQSDVVAESFRPGVMGGLGLDFESLRAVNEDLIMLSSSMAGQEGSFARFAGYAPMFVALSGLGEMTGYTDGPPSQIRVGGDIIAGVHGGFALLAAIFGHQATGRGTHIDLSAIEAQANLIGDAFLAYSAGGRVPTRRGNEEPGSSPHNAYRCRGEDQWVTIAVRSDEEWTALVGALGGPAWARDDRFGSVAGRDEHRVDLDRLLGTWTIERSPIEVTSALQGAGVAAMPSYRAPELFADPHVAARNLVVEVPGEGGDHPLIKLGGVLPASPLRLDRAGPAMGEHNHEVFTTLLGLSEEEIAALGEDEVFA